MTDLTKRQESILLTLVPEYINRAFPIGSKFLVKHYNLGVSSATMRAELQKLTETGYLKQPHTSAGRIPTDRGYHFYIEHLALRAPATKTRKQKFMEKITQSKNRKKIKQDLPRIIAEFSDNMAWTFYKADEEFLFDGLEKTIGQPEFFTRESTISLLETIQHLKNEVLSLAEVLEHNPQKVYIGREMPLLDSNDYSLVPSLFEEESLGRVIISVFGPKRMRYDTNIEIMRWLEEFFTA